MKESRTLRRVCALFSLLICVWSHADVQQEIADRGAIFTYLLDTGVPSLIPLSSPAVASKNGWHILEEDDLSHEFLGDCVILNDKLALVFRVGSAGAEVYTWDDKGPTYRATLAPIASSNAAEAALQQVEILENNPGAVMLRASFKTQDAKTNSLTYRLSTGQIQVEMNPGENVDAVRLIAETNFVVVPDFFADDLVYSAQDFDTSWAGLPAENFYLHLAEDGDVIITCAWESTGRNVRVLFSTGGAGRHISGSEIECVSGKTVWAAFAERADSWHAAEIPAAESASAITTNWMPPFSAKWRGDFSVSSEQAQSWNFLEERASDFDVAGHPPVVYPCWFENDRAYLQLPAPSERSTPVVVYPIDRTQATPLNLFVLVDVMRNTLGVGPCQYILDLEGLDAQTSPTPALVCDWIENRFQKKRAQKDADKIRARLEDMVGHVEHAEQRIARYAAFQKKIASILDASAVTETDFRRLLTEMDDSIKGLESARKSPAYAGELSGQIAELLDRPDWEAPFQEISHALHELGAAQDRTLSKCRMYVRRMKQYCLTLAGASPEAETLAKEITATIEVFLNEK